MSDVSGPQRIEVLESNVGEMKVELSYTSAQIEQLMGMMQQLLQGKSVYRSQYEEKSGGTGRGTHTMRTAAPEGHRAKKGLLAQGMAPQQ